MSVRPRAFEMLRSIERAGLTPAGWRCSPDLGREIDQAEALTHLADASWSEARPSFWIYQLTTAWGGHPAGTRLLAPPETFMDRPVAVDESLPPNALILDPVHSPVHSPDRS